MSKGEQRRVTLIAPKLAFSVAGAAETTSYSVETIRLAMRHGDLLASYANSKPVIRATELQRWLDSLPNDEPASSNHGGR